MQKKYVSVNAEVDTDGVIRPLLIRWHDGRQWEEMCIRDRSYDQPPLH